MSHIFNKVLKFIHPPLAYCYSASAIIFVLWVPWVQATLLHVNPYVKLGGFAETMGCDICHEHFTAETTTRFGRATNEITSKHRPHLPALTPTKPYRILSGYMAKTDYSEPTMPFAGHIQDHYFLPHNTILPTRISVKVAHA